MTTTDTIREGVINDIIHGHITGTEGARKLRISIRQCKRLKARYQRQGVEGIMHKARGVVGSRKTPTIVEDEIVRLVKDLYQGFGPQLLSEKLAGEHDIVLHPDTVRRIMVTHHLWKRKKHPKPEYHAWREPKASYGELQQFDGSYHDWFEGRNPAFPEVCLLASIDDATGKITCAWFDLHEGVIPVFQFWRAYVKEHGIPEAIYVDQYSTYKITHPSAVDNHDLMTQFQRVAQELTMRIITAYSPQAKGRIERLFKTLQDRLVKELRLMNISTIAEANIFLSTIFVPWFNNRFARVPRAHGDLHRPLPTALHDQLPFIFSCHHERRVNNDFTIRFRNQWYQLKEVQPTTIFKGDRVVMHEFLDGTIHIRKHLHELAFITLPERPRPLKKNPTILTTHRSNWTPPADHPWRQFTI